MPLLHELPSSLLNDIVELVMFAGDTPLARSSAFLDRGLNAVHDLALCSTLAASVACVQDRYVVPRTATKMMQWALRLETGAGGRLTRVHWLVVPLFMSDMDAGMASSALVVVGPKLVNLHTLELGECVDDTLVIGDALASLREVRRLSWTTDHNYGALANPSLLATLRPRADSLVSLVLDEPTPAQAQPASAPVPLVAIPRARATIARTFGWIVG